MYITIIINYYFLFQNAVSIMEEKTEVSPLPAIQAGLKVANKVKKKRAGRKHVKPKYVKKLSSFELQYSKLGENLIPEKKTIDYILVHPEVQGKEQEECRQKFENKLLKEGFLIDKEVCAGKVFKILSCPFKRLCMEAEKVKLQLPLSQASNNFTSVLLFLLDGSIYNWNLF